MSAEETKDKACTEDNQVKSEVDKLIELAKQGCVDRGVDPVSGKRGVCHSFAGRSGVCMCGDIDLTKERMK